MKPTGESNSFVLPPALLAEVEAAADEEHRPVADVVRELVEQGLSERRWKAHSEQELRRARELGLPDADDQPMSDEYRQTLREKIAQGMESARQGRLVDGDAVFARIKAEMAAIERQGG
jgi:Arc/MetJ-type ribon-helix-helix transcriptional regulator